MKAIRIPTDEELSRILNDQQRLINLPRRESLPRPRWVLLINEADDVVGLVHVLSITESIYSDLPWIAADWIWLVDMPRYLTEPIPNAQSRGHNVFDLVTDATMEQAVIRSLAPLDYHTRNRNQEISQQIGRDRQRGLSVPDSFEGHRPRR